MRIRARYAGEKEKDRQTVYKSKLGSLSDRRRFIMEFSKR